MSLRVSVVRPDEVGDLGAASGWHFTGAALAPLRLRSTAQDRRWQTRWIVAYQGDTVVGVLPIYRVQTAAAGDPIYDPRFVAATISSGAPDDARQWLYVGGFRDLLAGATVSATLSAANRCAVRRKLVTEAFTYGRREGLYPVSMYVRDDEVTAFDDVLAAGGKSAQVRTTAVLDLPGAAFGDYVEGLPKRDRYRVRRELLELAEFSMSAQAVDVADVIADAVPLIVATKQRYAVKDHPVLSSLRLQEWASGGADACRAFALRDSGGLVIGVSFASVHGATAELYELGLAEDAPNRLHAYIELLIYAPVRFALRHGCRRLVLGMDSIEPKARRGARVEPVWAITG